jgi:antibiotic biosynthesis monooxygenase (ABM) superfamily enzyme
MTLSSSARKPAWLIALIVAAVMLAVSVVFALVFSSIHILIITSVLLIPVLLVAGLLYLVEHVARRAVS